jgi:hypothetical protein
MLSLLVICGGINSKGECINDINMLDMKTMIWRSVIFGGVPFKERCAHSAAILDTRLYIFGGYNHKGFLPASLEILELGIVDNLNERQWYRTNAELEISQEGQKGSVC